MLFIDLFWITSLLIALVNLIFGLKLYGKNIKEFMIWTIGSILIHAIITSIILFTSIEGIFLKNLEFIYG